LRRLMPRNEDILTICAALQSRIQADNTIPHTNYPPKPHNNPNNQKPVSLTPKSNSPNPAQSQTKPKKGKSVGGSGKPVVQPGPRFDKAAYQRDLMRARRAAARAAKGQS